VENGVDFDYFHSEAAPAAGPAARRILFSGTMDYYPNQDAVRWFAAEVWGELRKRDPLLAFQIVGRNPPAAVRRLQGNGITVTGGVPDMRPYLRGALGMVAPLRLARGIQNKVLEALAMGLPVWASAAVADTFGEPLPTGITCCRRPADYAEAILAGAGPGPAAIRNAARERFTWSTNLDRLTAHLDACMAPV
jgi:glycosyltransferase involved in cell wall biosynthesis